MRILSRYLLREVALQAGLGLLIFTFVIFMQRVGQLLELTVRSDSLSVLMVFVDALPPALVFTLPMALLVGLLIGLGRMGVDQELLALRAAGVSSWQLLRPLLSFSVGVLALALAFTLWLAPAAYRHLTGMESDLATAGFAFEVQPRVFLESHPPYVIYVDDVLPGGSWRHVLVADMTDTNAPQLTMANAGELLHLGGNRFQLHLDHGASYQGPQTAQTASFASADMLLEPASDKVASPTLPALPTGELYQRARYGADWRLARVELHKRFALALACLALALAGIPLGLRSGRGGRAGGFVLTLAMVFVYYLVNLLGSRLAQQGNVPPGLGVWAADLIFFALGMWMLLRMDRQPAGVGAQLDPVARLRAALSWRQKCAADRPGRAYARGWMPSLLEGYLMREFLGYTALLLATFVGMVLVFTVFELSGDILHNQVPASVVLQFVTFLAPQMVYLMIPVAILLAVLITFGLMSKANEITALKACGVSAYRLIVPVLAVAAVLGGLQFALDATLLPGFNRKQDALHDQIKGRPPQTHQAPEWRWVFGSHNDIYYFRFFDPDRQEFDDLSVFRFDPQTFELTDRVYAHNARWDGALGAWVLSEGWDRGFDGAHTRSFQNFLVQAFPNLRETPAYFTTETRQGTQMTYLELRSYIGSLQQAGYNVARLRVQLSKKVAYPFITLVMALLAFSFALTVGRRGTIAGVSAGIGVAIFYWVASGLLEALGSLNQLPALLAAWTPDLLFLLASVYLLLRVPT